MAEAAGDLVADLTRWLAETRVDAAAASRTRERWLRQQLTEEATVAGVLLDLAERGRTVLVRCTGSRRLRVTVRAVAEDFCALRGADGTDVLLPYLSVVAVEASADAPSAGGRAPALDLTLADALVALAGDRARVLLTATDGSTIAGEVRSAGLDVVVLRPDSDARTTYVPIGSIAQVTLAG